MFRTPQGDSESDDERSPTTHSFSINQKSGCSHRAFDRPPLRPQFGRKYATASSTSSSSSSSTTSSIFDEDSTRAGTPLTPLISETPDSSNAGRPRLSSHGKLSTSSFMKRCVDTSNVPSPTPAPTKTSTAKRPSQYLAGSDIEMLVEGMKKLEVQDEEEASNTKGSLVLDNSPALAGRPQLKKKSGQHVQGDDDYSQSPMKNGVSNRKNKPRNAWTDETPSAKSKIQRSLNVAGALDAPQSSKKKSAETPSFVVTPTDSEGKEVDANSFGATAQNLPRPVQSQQKSTLSAPQASHKRSASAPGPHIKSNIIAQDKPIASKSSTNSSLTQPKKVDMPAALAPTRCSSRRRSTGSVVPKHIVLPPIAFSSPRDDEGMPGAFPNEPINISEVSCQSPSSEPPERTPDLHPDETRQSPKLEHIHPEKKNKTI
ncbi:hypothetical protein ACEPPN_007665 [Leptodophora sp. 'Broadleaf-Isolate-01']